MRDDEGELSAERERSVLQGLDVLDVGCGGGLLCEVHAPSHLTVSTLTPDPEPRPPRREHLRHRRVCLEHHHRLAACVL